MKQRLLALILLFTVATVHAQNGLENIIVEKYYVSNAADAAGSIGTLPVGSVTYRIYVDMLPGYKFQAVYGVPGHEMRIATTTTFFNNEDRGSTTPSYSKTLARNNSVMLDSWLSVGAACTGNFGIPKAEDNVVNGGATVINSNVPPILQNADTSAGIPLTQQDGLYAGAPQSVTFVGLSATDLDLFDAVSQTGSLFSSSNGSWASLNGSTGPIAATNRVLVAQLTTDGCLSFELNVQIGTPTGGTENYVARNPVGSEKVLPSLIYPVSDKPLVTVTKTPVGAICTGASTTFTAAVISGGSAPIYQWKKNGVNVGTNSPNYSLTSLKNGDKITCQVTSNAACLVSNVGISDTLTVVVNALPAATISTTGPTTFCTGTTPLTLTANAGTGLTYQWMKGTTVLAGATGQTYLPTTTSTLYKVVVTNANGCSKTSSVVAVKVNPLPAATITANGPTTFCSGTNPLTLVANTGSGFTYQWWKGTAVIAGATSQNYIPTVTSTLYKVQVTDSNGCSKTSSTIAVKVNALPTATITAGGPTTFCAGDSVQLQANTGAGLTYQWINGTAAISGSIASLYTAKTTGTYKVQVTNSTGCSRISSGKTVTVNCRLADDEQADHTMSIYPNPSSGSFTIDLTDVSDDVARSLELVDLMGQTVLVEQIPAEEQTFEVNTTGNARISTGVYILRLRTENQLITGKITINK